MICSSHFHKRKSYSWYTSISFFLLQLFQYAGRHIHVQRMSANHEKPNTLAYSPVWLLLQTRSPRSRTRPLAQVDKLRRYWKTTWAQNHNEKKNLDVGFPNAKKGNTKTSFWDHVRLAIFLIFRWFMQIVELLRVVHRLSANECLEFRCVLVASR